MLCRLDGTQALLGVQGQLFKEPFKHFLPACRTHDVGRVLVCVSRCASTQTLVSRSQRGLPHGTVCVADAQFGGRGRGSNTWVSPDGCLAFSGFLR